MINEAPECAFSGAPEYPFLGIYSTLQRSILRPFIVGRFLWRYVEAFTGLYFPFEDVRIG